jgi:hypothetical protein
MNTSRRAFLVLGAAAGSALALSRVAQAEAEKLSVADPAAQAVGYTEVAAKVDHARFPAYKAGQSCSNCSLYQGKATDPYGGCALFGAKLVAGAGWCSSYTNM